MVLHLIMTKVYKFTSSLWNTMQKKKKIKIKKKKHFPKDVESTVVYIFHAFNSMVLGTLLEREREREREQTVLRI